MGFPKCKRSRSAAAVLDLRAVGHYEDEFFGEPNALALGFLAGTSFSAGSFSRLGLGVKPLIPCMCARLGTEIGPYICDQPSAQLGTIQEMGSNEVGKCLTFHLVSSYPCFGGAQQ
ncbi:MAG TPA: hypothetical protein VF748_14585 [Candidatus Acidoferrum sp.]